MSKLVVAFLTPWSGVPNQNGVMRDGLWLVEAKSLNALYRTEYNYCHKVGAHSRANFEIVAQRSVLRDLRSRYRTGTYLPYQAQHKVIKFSAPAFFATRAKASTTINSCRSSSLSTRISTGVDDDNVDDDKKYLVIDK
jgi:hypothetical protein